MQKRSTVARILALPIRHKLFAAGVCAAITIVGLMPSRPVVTEYSSFALLAFDSAGTSRSAKEMAESILNDNALGKLAPHLGALNSLPPSAQVSAFRARLTIAQTQPARLKVTFRGKDPAQSIAAANAVANLLASWEPAVAYRKPAQQPAEPDPAPASVLYASLTIIRPTSYIVSDSLPSEQTTASQSADPNSRQQIQTRLQETESKLAELDIESHHLEETIAATKTERQRQTTQRQPLENQLADAKKKLEALRLRYTDAYPDVEAAKENIADLESAIAALPAIPNLSAQQARLDTVLKEKIELRSLRTTLQRQLLPASHTQAMQPPLATPAPPPHTPLSPPLLSQSRPSAKTPATPASPRSNRPQAAASAPTAVERQGPFSILVRAEFTTPETSSTRPAWLGFAIGLFAAAIYLGVALWRFRAVENVASLEPIIPADVAYIGSIPQMTRTSNR